MNLALEIRDGGKKYLRQFRFDLDACVRLRAYFDAVFALIGPTGATLLNCRVHPDGMFHIYFPGDYTVYSAGYLDADLPQRPFRAAKLSRERSAVPSLSTAQEQYFDPSFDAGLVYPDAMILGALYFTTIGGDANSTYLFTKEDSICLIFDHPQACNQ